MSAFDDVKAFLIAIPIAAAFATVTIATYLTVQAWPPAEWNFNGLFLYFVVAAFFISIAGVIVGLPIVWTLRRSGLMSLSALAFAGVFSGAITSWLVFSGGRNVELFPFAVGATSGLAAAITWWVKAERRAVYDI
mgnify:CR=1 FL=1